jgi:hypothetical protein
MKRLSSLFLLLMLLALQAKGQTVPPAQTLPYSENFNTLPHTSTALPTGWVSHNVISIKRLAHLLAEQMVGIRF